MSNPLAIAAATATLRNLLFTGMQAGDPSLSDLRVTTQPLDRARNGVTEAQLNLFLYSTTFNAGWRNRDLPSRTRPGEAGHPPMALDLHYILTAYGRGDTDNDGVSHRVLGGAMSVLHDHPVLGAGEIRDALAAADLHLQVERLRITPQPLPLEEMSKLWTSFQTHYRLSAGFQVSVLLIESRRPVRAPVPVLSRGEGDHGPTAAPGLENPFPNLTGAVFPAKQPGARPGDTVTLRGGNLAGTDVGVRFHTRWWTDPREVAPTSASDAAVGVVVPDLPADWPAGVYAAAVLVQRPGETYRRETNGLPLVLSPRIDSIAPDPVPRDGAGTATLTVGVRPDVLPVQRASLLLGEREVAAEPHATRTGTLTFVVRDAPTGTHWVRVRVDGADSILVRRDLTPPEFDPAQKVTVT